MEEKRIKLDVSSTLVEKSLDAAKGFLGKLISPAIEEAGLLIRESISLWRLKNQVRILNRAQEYCVRNNISPKVISFKLLCPLLENAALEEDEFLQDKWAILLSNLIDSEQNIENHVFPFLLSQVSKTEYSVLEQVNERRKARKISSTATLEIFRYQHAEQRELLETQIAAYGEVSINNWDNYFSKSQLEHTLREITDNESKIVDEISRPEEIASGDLKNYEIANLTRMGIVKIIPQHYIYAEAAKIENNKDERYLTLDDLDITIEDDGEIYVITALGELFIDACTSKRK